MKRVMARVYPRPGIRVQAQRARQTIDQAIVNADGSNRSAWAATGRDAANGYCVHDRPAIRSTALNMDYRLSRYRRGCPRDRLLECASSDVRRETKLARKRADKAIAGEKRTWLCDLLSHDRLSAGETW